MATGTYVDLEVVRRNLNIRDASDIDDDDIISAAVNAAARAIDEMCNRRTGFAPDTVASARTYRASGTSIFIDDVCSLTDFAVSTLAGGTSWTLATSFDPAIQLEPFNALADGRPYDQITGGRWSGLVQVTARWGWPAVPDAITQATKQLTERLFARKDSPAGVAGWDAMGAAVRVGRTDPDVQMLIGPYRNVSVA